jgi:hypothetical protein
MSRKKVNFSDLSPSLKVLVVLCWLFIVMNIIAFIVGFIQGLTY